MGPVATPPQRVPPADAVPCDDDDDEFYAPPVRRIVPAAQAQAITGLGPASIFDMAAAAKAAKALRMGGRFGGAGGFDPAPPYAEQRATVTRADGVTRCTGSKYPSNRWDEAREEQERQRRARQKPPRPTKRAKSRGRKVRMWDGEDVE